MKEEEKEEANLFVTTKQMQQVEHRLLCRFVSLRMLNTESLDYRNFEYIFLLFDRGIFIVAHPLTPRNRPRSTYDRPISYNRAIPEAIDEQIAATSTTGTPSQRKTSQRMTSIRVFACEFAE